MTSSIKWSFSSDRCFRRCQRQYFFREVAAHANARDPIRKEAYILKQLKTLEQWQGALVHRGIELFVVPKLQAQEPIDFQAAIDGTIAIARNQYAFSAARKYRDKVTKTKCGDNYCVLVPHEKKQQVSPTELEAVFAAIERCFTNLSEMDELLDKMSRRSQYWAELPVRIAYDLAQIEVRLDLLYFRLFGCPTIVDWKVSESMGGSDARLQMAFYAWALCQSQKWKVKRAEDCEAIEVQLLTKDAIYHRITEETFVQIENRIYRSLKKIASLREKRGYSLEEIEEYDYADNPNSCAYCGFQPLCLELSRQKVAEPVKKANIFVQGELF
jgi:PD-(D/E)XK nuclease superfamily